MCLFFLTVFKFGQIERSPWERAQIPNINLSESVHASWLAGEGGKRKITLYDACVTDVINSYIQCAKRLGYMTGRYLGSGPSMDNFLQRIAIDKTPSPAMVAKAMHSAVAGTSLYEEPVMQGDRETIQRKKRCLQETNASHRPGYVMQSRQRAKRGRPRKIHFPDIDNATNVQIIEDSTDEETTINADFVERNIPANDSQDILETDVKKEQWALRRTPIQCQRKCFGMVGRKGCSNILVSRDVGLVAPSFWSERVYQDKTIAQMLWFCNNDVLHTQKSKKQVKQSPLPPSIWPVNIGTNITMEEQASLEHAGFTIMKKDSDPATPHIRPSYAAAESSSRKRKWRHGVSKDAQKRIDSANAMNVIFQGEIVKEVNKDVKF